MPRSKLVTPKGPPVYRDVAERRDLFPKVANGDRGRNRTVTLHPYDRRLPTRYEIRHETKTLNGLPVYDRHWQVYDLLWNLTVATDSNQRPIVAEWYYRHGLYRREVAMYDEKPTGLLAALLDAQDHLARLPDLAGRFARLGEIGAHLGLGDAYRDEMIALARRHTEPALAYWQLRLPGVAADLLRDAREHPRRWETPYLTPASAKVRWRVEGTLLAVALLDGEGTLPVFVVQRKKARPWNGQRHSGHAHYWLAAERAAQLAPLMREATAERRDRLFLVGEMDLNHQVEETKVPRWLLQQRYTNKHAFLTLVEEERKRLAEGLDF